MIDVKSAVINIHGFPESEAESIRRCLETLYSIREGEQPMNRGLGLNMDFQDQPVNVAKNMFALEIIEKTRMYACGGGKGGVCRRRGRPADTGNSCEKR